MRREVTANVRQQLQVPPVTGRIVATCFLNHRLTACKAPVKRAYCVAGSQAVVHLYIIKQTNTL